MGLILFQVPVELEHINAYTYSQTLTKSNKNKKSSELRVRTQPGQTADIRPRSQAERWLKRKRPVLRFLLHEKEQQMENNCKRAVGDRQDQRE